MENKGLILSVVILLVIVALIIVALILHQRKYLYNIYNFNAGINGGFTSLVAAQQNPWGKLATISEVAKAQSKLNSTVCNFAWVSDSALPVMYSSASTARAGNGGCGTPGLNVWQGPGPTGGVWIKTSSKVPVSALQAQGYGVARIAM